MGNGHAVVLWKADRPTGRQGRGGRAPRVPRCETILARRLRKTRKKDRRGTRLQANAARCGRQNAQQRTGRMRRRWRGGRPPTANSVGAGAGQEVGWDHGVGGGSHLTKESSVDLRSAGCLPAERMVEHEVAPLRRRRPTPAPTLKAVGRLRRSTSGRPANRSGEGARVGGPRWRDHGATHMRPCRRPWSAHATMELHTPLGGRGGRWARRTPHRPARQPPPRGRDGLVKRQWARPQTTAVTARPSTFFERGRVSASRRWGGSPYA